MKQSCLILMLSLVPAAALSQSVSIDQIARCERMVLLQAQAAQNPSREFSIELQGQDGARLSYIGVRHSFDPADPQYAEMDKTWQQLQPTEAFYEGMGTFVGDTLTAALQRSGEPGLVRYLASRTGVPVHSLEPPRDAEVEFLSRSFTPEQLILFFVTRSVAEERDRRTLPASALDALFNQYLTEVHSTTQLAGALPDMPAFRAAYGRWFPGLDPALTPMKWFDPIHTSAETGSRFFNDVDRASSVFRDIYMYRLLAGAWRPGARIFAEVGRDHIPAQAAALRCALAQ
jgi:hypothetical protein